MYSCKKEFPLISSNNTTNAITTELNVDEANQTIEDFSKELAVLMNKQEIRTLIQTEISKKFDGDYDVLVKDLLKKIVTEDKAFESYLSIEMQYKLNKLIVQMPVLQVSIPINFTEWNSHDYVPQVAYIPYDVDIEKEEIINCFDSNGNKMQLSIQRAPETPVIVIGYCERVDFTGNVTYKPIDYNNQVYKTSSGASSYSTSVFKIKRVKVDDLNESWALGDAEVVVAFQDGDSYGELGGHAGFDLVIDRSNEGNWTGDLLENVDGEEWSTLTNNYYVFFFYEMDCYPTQFIDGGQYKYITHDSHDYLFFWYYGYDDMGHTIIDESEISGTSYSSPGIFDSSNGDVRFSAYE